MNFGPSVAPFLLMLTVTACIGENAPFEAFRSVGDERIQARVMSLEATVVYAAASLEVFGLLYVPCRLNVLRCLSNQAMEERR